MINQLSPEQNQQLRTWAEQRDTALAEVALARTDLENVTKINQALSASNSDLQNRANTLVDSIAEMVKEKAQLTQDLNIFRAGVQNKKNELESEFSGIEREVKLLMAQRDLLIEDIKTMTDMHDRVFKRVNVLDKVVDHVVRISDKNIETLNAFISNLKKP